MLGKVGLRCAFVAALILGAASGAFAADDGVWLVSKASGEVWVASDTAEPVSLNQDETLKPGNTIRTGRNGRVLLVRGEETILISPNSVVGLPSEKKEDLSTTIIQRAGSILLEVEKRNVKHFEVETPYLAAVVKGTQFSVTVGAGSTKVGVFRGQVDVADFKTGQIARVMPGQTATAFEHGQLGLKLGGAGTFNPIEHGKPRASTIERVPVPKSGLSAPRDAANGHAIHALGPVDKGLKSAIAPSPSHQAAGNQAVKTGVVRISSSLGEVKLNVHKATNGLAHGAIEPGRTRNGHSSAGTQTVWTEVKPGMTTATNSSTVTADVVSGSAPPAVATSVSSTAIAASSSGSTSDASGGFVGAALSGKGAVGNGFGFGLGLGLGLGLGNNGNNGNGNNGNGNSGHGNNDDHGNNGNRYGWGRGHH